MGEVVTFDPHRVRRGAPAPLRKGRPIRHVSGIIGETRELGPGAIEAIPYVNGKPARRLGLYKTAEAARVAVGVWFNEGRFFDGSPRGDAS